MSLCSALYLGDVVHARTRPRRHKLRYRVFSLLLDLDEMEGLDASSRVFGYNRRALLSFWDADHGNGRAGELRQWVEQRLADAGRLEEGMSIRVLCYPRILGYVFNPLTLYFCHAEDGTLRAILYEVCNTFGERHTYVIAVTGEPGATVEQSCAKDFYVSPFVGMDCTYGFHIEPPGDKVLVRIAETDAEGLFLVASFAGRREPISDRSLAGALLRYPLMTLKVTLGIYWEAFALWRKGVPIHRHRAAAQAVASSVVPTPEKTR